MVKILGNKSWHTHTHTSQDNIQNNTRSQTSNYDIYIYNCILYICIYILLYIMSFENLFEASLSRLGQEPHADLPPPRAVVILGDAHLLIRSPAVAVRRWSMWRGWCFLDHDHSRKWLSHVEKSQSLDDVHGPWGPPRGSRTSITLDMFIHDFMVIQAGEPATIGVFALANSGD